VHSPFCGALVALHGERDLACCLMEAHLGGELFKVGWCSDAQRLRIVTQGVWHGAAENGP
jgi:hypothetical protein